VGRISSLPLNKIPCSAKCFDGIRGEDLPRMAAWAAAETNPVYPVPVVYDQARFRRVLERLRA